MTSGQLEGKVAIVTGAASGIGNATVQAIADRGGSIVAADIDGERLTESLVGFSDRVFGQRADVGSESDAKELVDTAIARFGGLDLLINVAGVMAEHDSVEALPEAEWDRILRVNLKSIFLLSKFAIPRLRARGGGAIVNVASVHAFASMPETASYAASKGAIVALTAQMAADVACDQIRVVAVAPGSVDTPLTRRAVERIGKSLDELGMSTDPRKLGRVGSAEEVARVIAWLASPEASFINGATITVDGGLLAKLT